MLFNPLSWVGINSTALSNPLSATNRVITLLSPAQGIGSQGWVLNTFKAEEPVNLTTLSPPDHPTLPWSESASPQFPTSGTIIAFVVGCLLASGWERSRKRLIEVRHKDEEINRLEKGYQVLDQLLALDIGALNTGASDSALNVHDVFSPEQQQQLQTAVATLKAISLQTQGYKYHSRNQAAIVPPRTVALAESAELSGGSSVGLERVRRVKELESFGSSGFVESSSGLSSDDLLHTAHEFHGSVQMGAKNASTDSPADSKKSTKFVRFGPITTSNGPQVPKSASPSGSRLTIPAAAHTEAKPASASTSGSPKPSFDISSEEGRKALRDYIERKKKPEGPNLSTISSEAPKLTYAEVCRLDPATKKKYRRVFIANRGWISMGRLEEEERLYGPDALVKARTE
ncbi:uncharacterized protein CXQ87_003268 [Candidozyma duobushaemuli]|uniref:Uncharacterized protein n=1 Tax=Candidozyma duobushaemuli TaxID=1231522 RepID=A0A2V1ABV9_9ASCO|nr:uncharacterized protein CXQ87_003268 [[Candida] duobushaemulonis]PVH15428.1 hypothetical protein CXQ87_003268 [[Candida] duobushaemulonis]